MLSKYEKHYLLAIRSNHREFSLPEQEARYGVWQVFERKVSDGKSEKRYIQQINESESRLITYWRITTDPNNLPKNQTWYIKTDLKSDMAVKLGNLYGFRNWVEYAFKQGKNELGWADFRLTNYQFIASKLDFVSYSNSSLIVSRTVNFGSVTKSSSQSIDSVSLSSMNPVSRYRAYLISSSSKAFGIRIVQVLFMIPCRFPARFFSIPSPARV